jgi:prepilin-type processing-associated H-X9-DG protein
VEIVFTVSIIGILLAILLPAMSAIKVSAQKVKDVSNLKKIAEGWREYTINRGYFMGLNAANGVNYADYGNWFAYVLAGGPSIPINTSKCVINDPGIYISSGDKYASKIIKNYVATDSWSKVMSGEFTNDFSLLPVYENVFSYCTIGNLEASVPLNTTPIAFTRGLRKDGTWDKKYGLYGSTGGYIAYCDGHVTWYGGNNPVKFLKWDQTGYTSNIFEAIPNIARLGCGGVWKNSTTFPSIVIWGNGIGGE